MTDTNNFSVDPCDTGLGGFYFGCYHHIVLPIYQLCFTSYNHKRKELLVIFVGMYTMDKTS